MNVLCCVAMQCFTLSGTMILAALRSHMSPHNPPHAAVALLSQILAEMAIRMGRASAASYWQTLTPCNMCEPAAGLACRHCPDGSAAQVERITSQAEAGQPSSIAGLQLSCVQMLTCCRENPTALDQMLNEGKQMPKLPPHVRDGIRDYLHTRPEFRKLSKWTLLSQLTGPKVLLSFLNSLFPGSSLGIHAELPAEVGFADQGESLGGMDAPAAWNLPACRTRALSAAATALMLDVPEEQSLPNIAVRWVGLQVLPLGHAAHSMQQLTSGPVLCAALKRPVWLDRFALLNWTLAEGG